ncbi:glycosyltransferase [Carnobacterium sp. PL24RED07]|uniref:glycosyltransferase n=1 Tax=unclassified Carnobacterium TaxID=257487 RepID=UPI0011ECE8CA|nr:MULTISPECIES: glycosyltransferase [unclassified Carnobacterium]KAF3299975.1 glycosyltransferase [Carnobacterium sp. PL26RED25]KAF3304665.1 glycosyltransferase [Carnobacterium sp. PL24RED07]
MKKILFVASVVKLHINVFHIPTFKLLKEMGYEIHVAAKNDYVPKEDMKIDFCDYFHEVSFERSPFKKDNLESFKELEKIMLDGDFDIVHCHTPIGGALTRFVKMKNPNIKSEIIYTAHGFHFYKGAPIKNWIIFYPIEKFLSRYTDKLITINEEDYNYSKKMHAKENIYVPGVGIDLDKFIVSSPTEIERKRKELNIPENNLVLLSIGELSERKNHKVVIETLSNFSTENITYIICGQGPLRDELEDLVEQYNLTKQVLLLGFRNDINEICNVADIFVFPSIHEGLPVSVMEAMASRLPVIGSRIRGNTDLIDQDKGGYLGENTPNFYYESILKYMNNPVLAKNHGKYNFKKIQNYSINKIVETMRNVYSK